MQENEILLFILLQVINPKKFNEDGSVYIQKNKKQICIDISFTIDVVKLCLGKLLSYDIVNEQQYVKPPNDVKPEKKEIQHESMQELIQVDNVDKK